MKRKPKKIIALILALTFIALFSACEGSKETTAATMKTIVREETTMIVTTVPEETTMGIDDVIQKAMNEPDIQAIIEQSKDIIENGTTADIAAFSDDLVKKLANKTGLSVEVIKSHLADLSYNSFMESIYMDG